MRPSSLFVYVAIILLMVSCKSRYGWDCLVFVEGGDFYIGSNDSNADVDELNIRPVHVDDFYIGQYEITQAEWKVVMRGNPSFFHGDNLPVECVSWENAMFFIEKLNKRTGRHFRQPTPEEWEYAARGGKFAKGQTYSGGNNLTEVGWVDANSGGNTHPVGRLKPNQLGLYDMTGNVHEWCDGEYDSLYYAMDTIMNRDIAFKDIRIFKGGSWASHTRHCRISNINYNSREFRNFTIGFRLAESITTNTQNRRADGI